MRKAAFRHFDAQGLPHRRIEEWKYTDLRALMREANPLAGVPNAAAKANAKIAGQLLAAMDARRIVFVDGVFVPELSDLENLSPGLSIRPMAQALAAGDPLLAKHLGKVIAEDDSAVALNTAIMRKGAAITIANGATVERPIHLVFVAATETAASMFTRSLVVIENARAMLIESHDAANDAEHQINTALELVVGDEAHVDHIKITAGGRDMIHVSSMMTAIGARARFNDSATSPAAP